MWIWYRSLGNAREKHDRNTFRFRIAAAWVGPCFSFLPASLRTYCSAATTVCAAQP